MEAILALGEALMYDLMNEDISGFNPRQMPASGAGFDMKLKSAGTTERWLFEFLNNGYRTERLSRFDTPERVGLNIAGDRRSKAEIYGFYADYCSWTERTKPEPMSESWKKVWHRSGEARGFLRRNSRTGSASPDPI